MRLNRVPEAISLFNAQIVLLPNDPWGYYNLAAAYSYNRQTDEAVKQLSIALDKKMTELDHWQDDPFLDNVRTTPGFAAIVQKYFTPDEIKKRPRLFVVTRM